MILTLSAALLGSHLAFAVADKVPELDVAPGCRASAADTAGPRQDADVCIRAEHDARDVLAGEWNKFPAGDRTSCANLAKIGQGSTYTHLLTCLEMARDARRIPDEQRTTDGRGR